MLYPLKFKSVYKDYLWGGTSFREVYGREVDSDVIAESWDVACHKNGMSQVSNGILAGKTLEEIYDADPKALLGSSYENYGKFPLLIKLIDAKQRLSLQVHPEDAYAKANEKGELGKNEMWYVLSAEPGASLAIGLKDGVTKAQFAKAIEDGSLAEYVNEMPVEAGDVIDIPAGLLHAIQEGIMIAEVQQNSDTTYRVFDWNRLGADGKPRPLHVKQALDVIDFDQKIAKEKCHGKSSIIGESRLTQYIQNHYFGIDEITLKGNYLDSTELDHMMIYICLSGDFKLLWNGTETNLTAGETVLIPAELGQIELQGDSKILKAFLPTELTRTMN